MSAMQNVAAGILRIGGLLLLLMPTYGIAHGYMAICDVALPTGPISDEHLRMLVLLVFIMFDILATVWVARNLYVEDVLPVARAIAAEDPPSPRG